MYFHAGPNTPYLRHLFTHCVIAHVDSAVLPQIWAKSLDERLIDHATSVDLDGYVWASWLSKIWGCCRSAP